MSVTAAELARRARASSLVRIDKTSSAYFLGYWLQHGIVEEVLPGRYRLTDRGRRMAGGLLESEPAEATV